MFKLFHANSPYVEVDGRTVIAVTSGILVGSVAREMLESEGLDGIKPAGWYPQQKWLNVYRRIAENLGPDTLYSIGFRIPYSAQFPADAMNDVPSALKSIDVAYRDSHRGGEIGRYAFVEVGPDHYELHCDNPYANEFDFGIVASLVERYRGRLRFEVDFKQPAENPEDDNFCIIEVARV